MPAVGTYQGADKAGLGEGMLVTPHALTTLGPSFDTTLARSPSRPRPASPSARSRRPSARLGVPADAEVSWSVRCPRHRRPPALRRLRSTPVVLAALLVLLIMSTVVHALLLAVRRRRHDVAVLQCMGMRPGQVVRSALWQATTIASVAVVIGVPLGIVVGRWSWVVLAGGLGVVSEPTVPALVIAGVGLAVLVVALLAGLVPGWRSSAVIPPWS